MENLEEIQSILKSSGIQMTEDELRQVVTEFQYLVDIWLNDVERQLFNGKTLDELLIHSDL